MDLNAFFELSLATQVALAAGYLGYAIAYAGWREHHTTADEVLITIVFAAVASLVFQAASPLGAWIAAGAAVFASCLAAAIWRWGLRQGFLWLLSSLGVHREDGIHRGWAGVVQTKCAVDQAAVYLVSGHVLHLLDRRAYLDAPWQGLYLGGDGSVVMVVEEEDLPPVGPEDGTVKQRTEIRHDWGTRMTYIPAEQISRVELRMGKR